MENGSLSIVSTTTKRYIMWQKKIMNEIPRRNDDDDDDDDNAVSVAWLACPSVRPGDVCEVTGGEEEEEGWHVLLTSDPLPHSCLFSSTTWRPQ